MASQRIGRLSSAVAGQLRSHTVVSGFEQAVEELVCNSLDAGATSVRVQFDGGGAFVKVEDDGHGMSRDDLELVGVRHATSKLRTLEELEAGVSTLGFRGEALSSLADISILEVVSRVQGCPHTYCKIMQGSSTISLGLSSQHRARGTTVTMRDIFYNQPVRRRLFHSSSRKLLQSVKERIVRLALAHSDVSFILTDSLRLEEELHIRRHTSLYGTLRDIFGCELCQGLKEIDFAKGRRRLSGFLSSTQAYTSSKAIQYLYINHRFVHKTPLHKLLNRWRNSDAHMCGIRPKAMDKLDTSSSKQAYPAFILNLSCELSEYDITFEATKTYVEFKDWTSVLRFLENVLRASWGDEEGKREALQESRKRRRSWCRSEHAIESSLETKLKSKRACIERVGGDTTADLLQADSVSLPQLGCKSLRKGGVLGIGKWSGGERDGSHNFRGDLDIGSSSIWSQLAKPGHLKEEVGLLDQEISTPLLMDRNSASAHSLPDCSFPDILAGPHLQAIAISSSPVLSEGSWDSTFNADDFAIEVSSVKDSNRECGELQPALYCLGSDSSDICLEMPRPLRVRKPWLSPPTMKRDSHSMSEWTLPIGFSSIDVLLSPSTSWNELNMDGTRGALDADDMATESSSDVEESEFHRDLHRWSDRLENPGYNSRQHDDCAPGHRQGLELPRRMTSIPPIAGSCHVSCLASCAGASLFDCGTSALVEVGKGQGGIGQQGISLDEVDSAQQGECSNLQAELACTSPVEASVQGLAKLSKFRLDDEDLAPVASLYKVWSNPCMRANVSDILDVSAGILGCCNRPVQPDMVSKGSLQHARVLQQVDTKFVAIVAESVLLMVDQHAADERVQLEEFRAQVLAAGKKQCITILDAKHDLALGLGEQQTLHAYRKQIEDWGWRVQLGSESQNVGRNLVRNSGTCNVQLIAVPCILGVNLTAADLEEYLQQLGATQGVSVPPPAVIRLLNYKACRGAIMFGDPLLPAECRQLVSHLKRTSLCFQCAHGRPTMVPLVNLQNLRQKFEPQTWNDELVGTNRSTCEFQSDGASWHKLMRRPLSLLRAKERLHQQELKL